VKGHEAGLEEQRHLQAQALAQQQERSQVRGFEQPDGLPAGGAPCHPSASSTSSIGVVPGLPTHCHPCALQGAHPGAAGVGNKYEAAEREVLEVEHEKKVRRLLLGAEELLYGRLKKWSPVECQVSCLGRPPLAFFARQPRIHQHAALPAPALHYRLHLCRGRSSRT
jgi:hypothetical protein